mmetsp:Transcript_11796/g.12968  ORF Transcript_11796/g.12968 Transcript_11796/m.12968 type:complete len:109 (-) Transcript_11796:103-429(-)
MDWWPRQSPGWGNAGVYNVDLENKSLITLTTALSPAILRIGGTLCDSVVYVIDGIPHAECTKGISCLNMTRWHQMNEFASTTGVKMAFGLNEMYDGRKKRRTLEHLKR